MKRLILLIATVLLMTPRGVAQSTIPTATTTPIPPSASSLPLTEEARPRLLQARKPTYTDQRGFADDEEIYVRSGSNVPLPIATGATLVLRLDSSLSTSGMNGIEMSRDIPLRTSVLSSYAQVIAPKDILVETRIVGKGAGFKDRAELTIEPKTLLVEIDSFVLAGEQDGRRVFLKPGKWAIRLHCSILAIENPEGRSWYAKYENEGRIKAPKIGFDPSSSSTDDHASGLLYLPSYGPIIYGLTQIKGLIGFVFKRPNIKLPERTEIYFRIDKMEATYLSAPIPKGPAKITYQ